MSKIDRVKQYINEAINEIEPEIRKDSDKDRHGISKQILLDFKQNLEIMLQEVESNTIPHRDARSQKMGYLIVDSWPYNYPLGETILKAEQEYKEL